MAADAPCSVESPADEGGLALAPPQVRFSHCLVDQVVHHAHCQEREYHVEDQVADVHICLRWKICPLEIRICLKLFKA